MQIAPSAPYMANRDPQAYGAAEAYLRRVWYLR